MLLAYSLSQRSECCGPIPSAKGVSVVGLFPQPEPEQEESELNFIRFDFAAGSERFINGRTSTS